MSFFKSGLKGSMLGLAVFGGIAGVLALPLMPATIGLSALAAGGVALGGAIFGGLLGGAFGLASGDEDKEREYDRDTDNRIRELEDQLKSKEKEKSQEQGLFGKLFSFLGPVIALLGIGGAAYGGYRFFKSRKEEKGPDGPGATEPDAPAPKPDDPARDPAPEEAPEVGSLRHRREVIVATTASDRNLRLAAASLASAGVSGARDVDSLPDGVAHTAATPQAQKARGHE